MMSHHVPYLILQYASSTNGMTKIHEGPILGHSPIQLSMLKMRSSSDSSRHVSFLFLIV